MTEAKSREKVEEPWASTGELPSCWSDAARHLAGGSFSDGVRPWNWLELGAANAEQLWDLLVSFVNFLNHRYGDIDARRVPPCWTEHGAIVEELTTLSFARWQAFSSEHASIGGAEYWHTYTLHAFYQRLGAWLGDDALYCRQGRHRRDAEPAALDWEARTREVRDLDLRIRRASASEKDVPAQRLTVSFLERDGA